jgi:hypothetical protein
MVVVVVESEQYPLPRAAGKQTREMPGSLLLATRSFVDANPRRFMVRVSHHPDSYYICRSRAKCRNCRLHLLPGYSGSGSACCCK